MITFKWTVSTTIPLNIEWNNVEYIVETKPLKYSRVSN